MASAAGSLFARLYAGHTGVDPYTTAVSDTYQDLFGEGIFTGKGLYDVDAFTAALDGRVPEYALLSHDLFEGIYARTALVSDVELVDDYPASVLAHARRQHRWVRGDWQILRWLFPWVRNRAGGLRAQPAAADLALEDPRQPAAQPGPAGDGGAAARGVDRAAREPRGVDGGGARRARLPALPAAAGDPRRARAAAAGAGLPARRGRRAGGGAGAGRPAARLPRQPGVGDGARHLGHAGAAGHPAPAAGVGDRRRQRRTRRAAQRARTAPLPARDGGEPAARRRRAASPWRPRGRARCRWRRRSCCCGCWRRRSPTSLSRPVAPRQRRARRRGPPLPRRRWRATPGATSPPSPAPTTTGCRPTTSRRSPSRASPTAPRRPTSAWGCWRRSPRTTSASSTPAS